MISRKLDYQGLNLTILRRKKLYFVIIWLTVFGIDIKAYVSLNNFTPSEVDLAYLISIIKQHIRLYIPSSRPNG